MTLPEALKISDIVRRKGDPRHCGHDGTKWLTAEYLVYPCNNMYSSSSLTIEDLKADDWEAKSLKKRVYLCSRLAADARPLNEEASSALERAGYEVFVPHLQPYNTDSGYTDQQIYSHDMKAMLAADACVIVGRIGVDCAFEVGWFQARGVPTVWWKPTKGSPMLDYVAKRENLDGVLSFLSHGEDLE